MVFVFYTALNAAFRVGGMRRVVTTRVLRQSGHPARVLFVLTLRVPIDPCLTGFDPFLPVDLFYVYFLDCFLYLYFYFFYSFFVVVYWFILFFFLWEIYRKVTKEKAEIISWNHFGNLLGILVFWIYFWIIFILSSCIFWVTWN